MMLTYLICKKHGHDVEYALGEINIWQVINRLKSKRFTFSSYPLDFASVSSSAMVIDKFRKVQEW
jgi:hypothetical protein